MSYILASAAVCLVFISLMSLVMYRRRIVGVKQQRLMDEPVHDEESNSGLFFQFGGQKFGMQFEHIPDSSVVFHVIGGNRSLIKTLSLRVLLADGSDHVFRGETLIRGQVWRLPPVTTPISKIELSLQNEEALNIRSGS